MASRLDSSRKQLQSNLIHAVKDFDSALCDRPDHHFHSGERTATAAGPADSASRADATGSPPESASCRATFAQGFRPHSETRAAEDRSVRTQTAYDRECAYRSVHPEAARIFDGWRLDRSRRSTFVGD